MIYLPLMSESAGAPADRSAGLPRLLLITPDYPPARGGIQLLVHRLANGLGGFRTHVVTLGRDGAREFDAQEPVSISRARSLPRLGPARNVPLNALALAQAARLRPDVTLSAHLVTSPAAAVIASTLRAPTVQYFYAKEIADKPRLAAFAAGRARAAISISSYTSGLLEAVGVAPGKIRLIPPGVDTPPDPTPEASERPTVLTISRLADRYKGHDVLMRSIASVRQAVPEVQWVVIGDGPLRGELEQLAGAHGIADRVRFLGSVSDELRNAWLRRADVLAMPSRLPGEGRAGEGFGMVYLEAGSYGKPVVAGNVAGAVDAVIDGETGLLVDPTDANAVGAAITRLLLDRELAHRLGAAGARHAASFAWPLILARVEAVLLEALAGSGRHP